METITGTTEAPFIYLSRNSKLARWFQEAGTPNPVNLPPARRTPLPPQPPRPTGVAIPSARPAARACPKLQSVENPSMDLSRPLVSALMREGGGLKCRKRGVLLDNEYVRDVCSSGCYQHCPFLGD